VAIDVSTLSADGRGVLSAAVRRNRNIIAARARENPNVFAVHVLRDDRTGRRIRQGPHHVKWHELAAAHDRLLIWSAVDMGKTVGLSIGRTLWELGRNPNLRIAILSKTKNLAQKIVRTCGQHISKSAPLHEVFPHLVPETDPSLPWTSLALTVAGRLGDPKDPSVQAAGAFGNIIGSRIDRLIIDDILDSVNTRTPAPRDALYDWVRAIMGRLSEDARVLMVGNAWHPDDVMHRFASEPGYTAYKFPVMDKQGTPTWPEHWSAARIEKARTVDFGPLDFARQLLCQPRDDDSARFKREWLETALTRGIGLEMLCTRQELLDELASPAQAAIYRLSGQDCSGIRVYVGVDLGVQQHARADPSAFVAVAALPDGSRRLLHVECGRWGAPEILSRIEDHNTRYQPIFIVENVGAQDYILQMVRHTSAIPVLPFTTGKQKASVEFGVEAIAAELHAGKWIFPCESRTAMNREVNDLVQEVLSYEPPPTHTGDRLMGMYFAQSAIRAEEARRGGYGSAKARVLVFGVDEQDAAQDAFGSDPT
jgi:hypothetical protein